MKKVEENFMLLEAKPRRELGLGSPKSSLGPYYYWPLFSNNRSVSSLSNEVY
jgi:hypothetical protein